MIITIDKVFYFMDQHMHITLYKIKCIYPVHEIIINNYAINTSKLMWRPSACHANKAPTQHAAFRLGSP